MNEEFKKAKRRVVVLFIVYLGIALACFGVVAYFVIAYRSGKIANERISDISKCVAMVGILFLVMAFGHLLPGLMAVRKRERGGVENDGEAQMRRALERYLPDGETLLSGVYVRSKETNIRGMFGKCVRGENSLIPVENGGIVAVNKKKYSDYDLYLGITQQFLIAAECSKNSYYYQFYDNADAQGEEIQEVSAELPFADIGTRFPLSDVQSCEIKKGLFGSLRCFLTIKNGSYFKLLFPAPSGMCARMPHYTQYRDEVIAWLGGRNDKQ